MPSALHLGHPCPACGSPMHAAGLACGFGVRVEAPVAANEFMHLSPEHLHFLRLFIKCEGRNVSTRRGLIGTSWPVFGLRPTRADLLRMENVPKDEILTCSPCTNASDIWSRTLSTNCAESFRERPTSRNTASLKSILVNVLLLITSPLFIASTLGGKEFTSQCQ